MSGERVIEIRFDESPFVFWFCRTIKESEQSKPM